MTPVLKEVRFSCFSTGTGFLEFWIQYTDATPEQISNFAYRFKKAKVPQDKIAPGKRSLYDVALSLLPQKLSAQLFFTAATEFKYECYGYHFLHMDQAPENETADQWLFWLRRSYSSGFNISAIDEIDMVYKPCDYDHWSGSSEGLVNITYDLNNNSDDRYLHDFKYSHLRVDYYFMYILLLNQRFTCIRYITQISQTLYSKPSGIEMLNRKIVDFKTLFAFNIVSDDRLFQTVYSKMYTILGIKHLLDDILDNESQIAVLRNVSSAKSERLSNRFLFGISLLSIFSALFDASSYFERFDKLSRISTTLGLVSTCAVICLCVMWIIKSRDS